jgi:hypothetical protein
VSVSGSCVRDRKLMAATIYAGAEISKNKKSLLDGP